MTKKRKTLRILASIIAAGCVWSAGMNDVFAYDTANHGNSYEAMVVLSATKETNGSTGLGIALYRGDRKNTATNTYQNPDVHYMTEAEAKAALGDLYNDTYAYTVVESNATAEFNKVLTTTVINDVRAMVEKGQNVYITGNGTNESPYVINAVDSNIKNIQHSKVSDYTDATNDGGVVTTTVIEMVPEYDANGNLVRDASGKIKYKEKAHTASFDISDYVGDVVKNEAGDAIYSGNTTINEQITENKNNISQNTSVINQHSQQISQNTTNITNNKNEIDNIKNKYVQQITDNGNDTWTVIQTNGGTVTITDEHINSHTMVINGDSIESKITTNFGSEFRQSVRVGDAVINYAGDIIVPNQDGTVTNLDKTIENAINNNYNKIVNVENNNVSEISERKTENITNNYGDSYNVSYYEVTQKVNGQDVPVKIKDTTLIPKGVFGGARLIDVFKSDVNIQDDSDPEIQAMRAYINQNALVGRVDPVTGMPQIMMEFEDTSGNVVQGALDFGSMIADATEMTSDDGNIVITSNNSALGHSYNLARQVDVHTSVTVADVVHIDNRGINMGNTNITGLAPGEISATSTEAINGSQLYQTNQNLDRLGSRVDKVGAGAAALAALHPMDFDPDDKLQFSAGVGNYGGETAAALGAFYRPTEKVMFSMAGTMGNGENMVNAGVTFALDRKNNVSNSRVAMAHEIQDLRDQVAALTALVTQLAGKGNPLLDTVMFPDVPENHWAYDYIDSLQKRGIIEGYPDGNFGGDRSCTRYEYAAMLYRALEKGFPVDSRLLDEFKAELGRIRIDRIKGIDADANKVERVRVNDYEGRDDYGSKLAQVVGNAAPVSEEPAA